MKYIWQSLRQAAQVARRKLARRWLRWRLRHQPAAEALDAERKLRGAEQHRRLRGADLVVVSFGKSGRTWLRVMLSHLLRVQHGLPGKALLSFDNFHNIDRRVPKIFFTHDNYIKDHTGEPDSKRPFYDKPVALLARDPRDVAVSQFFQWQFRIKPDKLAINNYPPRGADVSLFDFVTGNSGGGMNAVIDYLNLWAREAGHLQRFHLLRYEDLRAAPHQQLEGLLRFLRLDATAEAIDAAVEYASFDNMKKLESGGRFRFAGGRMVPGDRGNPDSYKVRRAKVGGYRDYFSDDQVRYIDAQLTARLDPFFNYR